MKKPVSAFYRVVMALTRLAVLPLLLLAAEGRAQSALDGFNPGANNIVETLAVQGDGKILVGGWFTTLGGGGTGTTPRSRIGRLNPDSTTDDNFNPGANGKVNVLAVQADELRHSGASAAPAERPGRRF